MLKCKEIYYHLAGEQDLPLLKRLQIPLHLFVCTKCRKLKKQYAAMKRGITNLYAQTTDIPKEKTEELANKISRRLH